MGMTIDQATEAARAMGKIAGGGAKERFRNGWGNRISYERNCS